MARCAVKFLSALVFLGVWSGPVLGQQPVRKPVDEAATKAAVEAMDAAVELTKEELFFFEVAPPPEVKSEPVIASFLWAPHKAADTDQESFLEKFLRSAFESQKRKAVGKIDDLLLYQKRPIRVCFVRGREVRQSIVKAALQWQVEGSGIEFDFGDRDNPQSCPTILNDYKNFDIRVGFGKRGTWALMGSALRTTDAIHTMEFDLDRLSGELERAARHEFGHAIGLKHEHQSPNAKCEDEIDWPKAEQYLKNEWLVGNSAIIRQFRALSSEYYEATRYDGDSVMNYFLPKKFFKKELTQNDARPSCYQPKRFDVSDIDSNWVKEKYPADPKKWTEVRQKEARDLYNAVSLGSFDPIEKQQALAAAYALGPWRDELSNESFESWLDTTLKTRNALDRLAAPVN